MRWCALILSRVRQRASWAVLSSVAAAEAVGVAAPGKRFPPGPWFHSDKRSGAGEVAAVAAGRAGPQRLAIHRGRFASAEELSRRRKVRL